MSPREKRTGSTTATPNKRAPEIVMEEVDDFPAGADVGTGAANRWPDALTKVMTEAPGKVVCLAKFRGKDGASNTRKSIVGGGKKKGVVQGDKYPTGTTADNWQLVARPIAEGSEASADGEFKSALYARFTPSDEVVAAE